MEKKEMLYEGKAKQVFATDDENLVIIHYKDAATAFNNLKKATIDNKGVLNNEITTIIFKKLNEAGIPTHYIETLNDRDQLCHKVSIVPLEVIVRNIIAGSMAKRLGIEEGTPAPNTIMEICYKDDALGDPLINDHHAVALGAATYAELAEIYDMTARKTADGKIVLADEISPDTCRLWDATTNEKLDKDRFRRDLGNVIGAYEEIDSRLNSIR